jgi:hypothetical protein
MRNRNTMHHNSSTSFGFSISFHVYTVSQERYQVTELRDFKGSNLLWNANMYVYTVKVRTGKIPTRGKSHWGNGVTCCWYFWQIHMHHTPDICVLIVQFLSYLCTCSMGLTLNFLLNTLKVYKTGTAVRGCMFKGQVTVQLP